jgi:hypothetical protein
VPQGDCYSGANPSGFPLHVSGMTPARLKQAIKRGAMLALANWPVLVVQFVGESTFKLLLAVPVVGGAFLVALALGRDVNEVLGDDLRESVTGVAESLVTYPGAFAGFAVALLIVVLGGSVIMFMLKGGTLNVLVEAQRHAGPVERYPLRLSLVRRASRAHVDIFLSGVRRLRRRFLRLGFLLLGVYAASTGLYLLVVFTGYHALGEEGLVLGWTALAAAFSAVLVGWLTIVNTVYLVVQVVVAAADVSVRRGAGMALALLRAEPRLVLGIFAVTVGLVGLATLASIITTAGLGLISFVPFVGLTVLPLQLVAWLLRGLLFQYLGLTSAGAYLNVFEAQGTDGAQESPRLRA